MRKRFGANHAIGIVGVLLIAGVAKLAKPAYVPQIARRQPVRRYLAQRAIDSLFTVARIIDRMGGTPVRTTRPEAAAANRPAMAR